jgi:hypothetical protein
LEISPEITTRSWLVQPESSRRLDQMSVTGIENSYRTAYLACRVEGDRVPSRRSIQELVRAWKQVRKWK